MIRVGADITDEERICSRRKVAWAIMRMLPIAVSMRISMLKPFFRYTIAITSTSPEAGGGELRG